MKKLIALIMLTLLLCGCGAQEAAEPAVQADVNELYASLEAVGLPNMLDMAPDMQLNIYGIRAEDVKQSKVVVCTDGLRADEVWLIEAVSAEAAAKIKTLAENRVKQKDAESITYSPEQNVIVKKSHISVEGNFVIFICSPDVEKLVVAVQAGLGK
jgi:hypothetical protein